MSEAAEYADYGLGPKELEYGLDRDKKHVSPDQIAVDGIANAIDGVERHIGEASNTNNDDNTTYVAETYGMFLQRASQHRLLKAHEEVALARRIERGDLAAKERLINSNLRLVIHTAKHYYPEDTSFTRMDIIQEGMLGLVRAAEKFDHRKGFRFSTYATLWIRQAIQRGLGDKARMIRLPIQVGQRVNKLERAERSLTKELQQMPSDADVAERLETTQAEVVELRRISMKTTSLDIPVGDGNDASVGDLIEGQNGDPCELTGQSLLKEHLGDALENLNGRERRVIELRHLWESLGYAKQPTLKEVGRELSVTTGRVRQLENKALGNLAKQRGLQDYRGAF